MIQSCVITGWHPTTNPNQRTSHWATDRKRHKIDAETAWATAKHAGWAFVPGKVRLTITLVYAANRLPDRDNAMARCKGIIDGLRSAHSHKEINERMNGQYGFFFDDSPEWLDLIVETLYEKGTKETRLRLESLSDSISAD